MAPWDGADSQRNSVPLPGTSGSLMAQRTYAFGAHLGLSHASQCLPSYFLTPKLSKIDAVLVTLKPTTLPLRRTVGALKHFPNSFQKQQGIRQLLPCLSPTDRIISHPTSFGPKLTPPPPPPDPCVPLGPALRGGGGGGWDVREHLRGSSRPSGPMLHTPTPGQWGEGGTDRTFRAGGPRPFFPPFTVPLPSSRAQPGRVPLMHPLSQRPFLWEGAPHCVSL